MLPKNSAASSLFFPIYMKQKRLLRKKSIRCIQKFTTHIAVGIIPKPVI